MRCTPRVEREALERGLGGWCCGAEAAEGVGAGAGEGRYAVDYAMTETRKEEEKRRGKRICAKLLKRPNN